MYGKQKKLLKRETWCKILHAEQHQSGIANAGLVGDMNNVIQNG